MFRDSNPLFCEKLLELEADPITQGLSLQSFLTLPMQRITRLPLLVDVGLYYVSLIHEIFAHRNFAQDQFSCVPESPYWFLCSISCFPFVYTWHLCHMTWNSARIVDTSRNLLYAQQISWVYRMLIQLIKLFYLFVCLFFRQFAEGVNLPVKNFLKLTQPLRHWMKLVNKFYSFAIRFFLAGAKTRVYFLNISKFNSIIIQEN